MSIQAQVPAKAAWLAGPAHRWKHFRHRRMRDRAATLSGGTHVTSCDVVLCNAPFNPAFFAASALLTDWLTFERAPQYPGNDQHCSNNQIQTVPCKNVLARLEQDGQADRNPDQLQTLAPTIAFVLPRRLAGEDLPWRSCIRPQMPQRGDHSQSSIADKIGVTAKPSGNGIRGSEAAHGVPPQVTFAGRFQMPPNVRSRTESFDQAVQGNSGADVFDYVALRPNPGLPRKHQQVKHDGGDAFTQAAFV